MGLGESIKKNKKALIVTGIVVGGFFAYKLISNKIKAKKQKQKDLNEDIRVINQQDYGKPVDTTTNSGWKNWWSSLLFIP